MSDLTGIYTRAELDDCLQKMRNGYFPRISSIHGRALRVMGCVVYIHACQEDDTTRDAGERTRKLT
jgi:hypothetical protein